MLFRSHTASGFWVNTDRETTINGLYAAGDVAGGCPQKYVTGALAEGEIAALDIISKLNDEKNCGKLDENVENFLDNQKKQIIGQYEKIDDFLNENSRKKNIGKYYVTNKASESISIAKEMTREDINILDLETQISTIVKQIKIWNGIQ